MAKSKIQESHTLKVEGVLNVEDMAIEVEDIGVKTLADLFARFNGCNIKISIGLNNEILE